MAPLQGRICEVTPDLDVACESSEPHLAPLTLRPLCKALLSIA